MRGFNDECVGLTNGFCVLMKGILTPKFVRQDDHRRTLAFCFPLAGKPHGQELQVAPYFQCIQLILDSDCRDLKAFAGVNADHVAKGKAMNRFPNWSSAKPGQFDQFALGDHCACMEVTMFDHSLQYFKCLFGFAHVWSLIRDPLLSLIKIFFLTYNQYIGRICTANLYYEGCSMKYSPQKEACPLPFSPFKSCTVPRPIGWLSSVSAAGIENIAPYSQWQNLTFGPPMVMFAANRYPDGRRKDTVLNAEETGWFVWNMATYDLRDAVNISAMALAPEESEFDRLDVTREYADNAPVPMVRESPCKFECRYLSTHTQKGGSTTGTVDVVFAQVEKIHIDDRYIRSDGRLDISAIQPIARMGYFDYTVVRETFEMRVPESDSDAQAGLEGRF